MYFAAGHNITGCMNFCVIFMAVTLNMTYVNKFRQKHKKSSCNSAGCTIDSILSKK